MSAQNGEFEVLVLGVGDTFSERYHSTSLLLMCDGFSLAIDCPDMYRGVLKDASRVSGRSIELSGVNDILITHVHGDHMNGLEGVAFYKHFVEQKKLNLITSNEVRANIWDERLKASMGVLWNGASFVSKAFDDYFDFRPLNWEGPIAIGPFEVRSKKTKHHVPTSALLVTAKGRTLGYSADTAFDPELIDFLSPADLIIHETNFGPAHTRYDALAQLPVTLRNKMKLIHYSDLFDTEESGIKCASQGEILVP